ncbi:Hypothetical_protein [Hexamita inflata]|uniref:Hypothetical_protein n=1 Tax=Hexamita inflata TaxID=28002 RepID=A0AA86US57_9EUKA|nr:Hypothetical protein HINF_LOCUS57225 [Hexamita inflata]
MKSQLSSIQNHQPHFDKQISKIHGYTGKLESQCPTTENKQTMFSGKRLRKAQDQPTELNLQEIDQTEEFSSIPVNETTNSNAGIQNTSVKPKKKPRQKSQVFLYNQRIKIPTKAKQ